MHDLHDDVSTITRSVWNAMLGMELTEAYGDAPTGMTGWVEIHGAWNGMVTVSCSPAAARFAAGAMFDVAPDDTSSEDVDDALRELANMIGGNVKALLPEPCQLGLPHIVGHDPTPAACDSGTPVSTVELDCAGERLVVTVIADDQMNSSDSDTDHHNQMGEA